MHEFSPTFRSPSLNLASTRGRRSSATLLTHSGRGAAQTRAPHFLSMHLSKHAEVSLRGGCLLVSRTTRAASGCESVHALPKQLDAILHLLQKPRTRLEPAAATAAREQPRRTCLAISNAFFFSSAEPLPPIGAAAGGAMSATATRAREADRASCMRAVPAANGRVRCRFCTRSGALSRTNEQRQVSWLYQGSARRPAALSWRRKCGPLGSRSGRGPHAPGWSQQLMSSHTAAHSLMPGCALTALSPRAAHGFTLVKCSSTGG